MGFQTSPNSAHIDPHPTEKKLTLDCAPYEYNPRENEDTTSPPGILSAAAALADEAAAADGPV